MSRVRIVGRCARVRGLLVYRVVMASTLEPRAGFDWTKVRWTGPYALVDETCSYCSRPVGECPLRLWTQQHWAAVFCDECMWAWWGIVRAADDELDDDDGGP
jgi:hypothetical protein